MAISPAGTVVYYNDTYDSYWDVEPTSSGSKTVLYSAAEKVTNESLCSDTQCLRNVVEQVNLSTGNVTRLYSRVEPNYHNSEWHNVDRINETHFLVADIAPEPRVRCQRVERRHHVRVGGAESLSARGGWPLPPRLVAHQRLRTAGRRPNHDESSEHGSGHLRRPKDGTRAVELDARHGRRPRDPLRTAQPRLHPHLQSPRDANRLPNDHTHVTDTHGDRVLEVNRQGDVVWSVAVMLPYEAERLETGDGSTNGLSATAAGLASRGGGTAEESGGRAGVLSRVADSLPPKLVNGILFVIPRWMGLFEIAGSLLLVAVLPSGGARTLLVASLGSDSVRQG